MIDLHALRVAASLACVLPALLSGALAWGAFPEKPIRVIVPSPPGGGNDIMARLASQKLAESWGKQVVVDNRPGAGGAIAFEMAARAEANGYTLLLASTNLTVLPDIQKVNYHPIKDFVPVSLMATSMNVLLVHPSVPVKSTKDLIALAKLSPGKLNYATSIATSVHLAAELFKAKAGVNIVMVPYKGMGPALVDLIAGHVDIAFANPAASQDYVRSGRLRALAVTGERRFAMMPEVPTVAEAAIPEFEASTWWGILAPAGTPAAIVSEVNGKLVAALTHRDVMDRIAALGADLVGGPPERLAEHLNAEIPKWREVVRAANIRL
ncbi:MAG: tripartite tricarboxylate transporter substrate binding protein [Betaproteobacteria bacterium]|nr:tripartite tricarboxylate transporter substrate binding protein [Betaproteobacteria bacterium]